MRPTIKLSAPCKFNLFLRILDLDAQANKYNIYSMFVRSQQFVDEITINEVDQLASNIRVLYTDANNKQLLIDNCLVKKTLAYLIKRYQPNNLPGLLIEIKKVIPMQAGLGGAAADAATIINWFYERFQVSDTAQVPHYEIARDLGSDIPFFMHNVPCAIVSGIGDRVAVCAVKQPAHEIIINPLSCPTAAVFAAYRQIGRNLYPFLENDLMPAAFLVQPELKTVYQQLRARYTNVIMTGAGSAFVVLKPAGDCNE